MFDEKGKIITFAVHKKYVKSVKLLIKSYLTMVTACRRNFKT